MLLFIDFPKNNRIQYPGGKLATSNGICVQTALFDRLLLNIYYLTLILRAWIGGLYCFGIYLYPDFMFDLLLLTTWWVANNLAWMGLRGNCPVLYTATACLIICF